MDKINPMDVHESGDIFGDLLEQEKIDTMMKDVRGSKRGFGTKITWREKTTQLWVIRDSRTKQIMCDKVGRPKIFVQYPRNYKGKNKHCEPVPIMLVVTPGWRTDLEKETVKKYLSEDCGLIGSRLIEELDIEIHEDLGA